MKHDFLDDDWLKQQLAEDHLNDDDFSHSVMQKIGEQRQASYWYLYLLSAAILASLGYLVIALLGSIFTAVPFERPVLFDTEWTNLLNGSQVDPVTVFLVVLAFAIIWSLEEFDLL